MLKSRYDLVIIDTPPVMAVADARIIGQVVDKTIFVVRWDKTPRKVAKAAMEQLIDELKRYVDYSQPLTWVQG